MAYRTRKCASRRLKASRRKTNLITHRGGKWLWEAFTK